MKRSTTLKNLIALFCLTIGAAVVANDAAPVPESAQEREQRMAWFIEAKYGMFIHFGLYSQLGAEWKGVQAPWYAEWIQATQDIPREEYADLVSGFNPEGFDAELLVGAAKDAGMTYLVVTSKHHEGFCLWDSELTEFDVASTPFNGRDILQELKDACDENGLKFGIYYSIIDWNHPTQMRNEDEEHHFKRWGQCLMVDGKKQEYVEYMTGQVKELLDRYDPAMLWFDGDWVNWWTQEDGIELYNTIRENDSDVIVNNRVAKRETFDLDFVTQEQEHFDEAFGKPWEGCYTMNESWGYKKHDHEWKTPQTVYQKLKDINEKGGNLLLNVGPDGDGVVQPEAYEILQETAKLLEANPTQKPQLVVK